jgi:hypothetical protein
MGSATTAGTSRQKEEKILRQFRKGFFQNWDMRFVAIVVLVIIAEAVFVGVMAQRPVPEYSEEQTKQVQEEYYVRLRTEEEQDLQTADLEAGRLSSEEADMASAEINGESEGTGEESAGEGAGEAGEGAGSEGTGAPSLERRMAERRATAGARREAIRQEVSGKGLLRSLTGTGTAAMGMPVENPFRGGGGGETDDLDPVINTVTGLKTQGRSGLSGAGEGGVRGERTQRETSISDLVAEVETATTTSDLSKTGELVVETPAAVEGRGRKSIHRSQDAIHEVIYSHLPAIRFCYERELKKFPNLKGKIDLRITVAADGSVSHVELISSTINNSRVERCIISRIMNWKDFKPIDSDEGNVTFRQGFAFGY